MEKLSSVKYLVENVKRLTNGMSLQQVHEEFGVHPETHKRMLAGDVDKLSLTIIQRYSINSDTGISELFINPELSGRYIPWYRETQLYCFTQNFRDYMEVNGFTPKDVVGPMGKSKNVIRGYQNGIGYPRVGDLDRIAEVLDVEVADLFLP